MLSARRAPEEHVWTSVARRPAPRALHPSRARTLVVIQTGECLGEDGVGAAFLDVQLGPLDGRFHALDADGIGARHDEEIGIRARIAGRLKARDHLHGWHHLLIRTVAAALDGHLVLDVDAPHADRLHVLDGTRDAQRAAEACVDVDEQGRAAAIDDARDAARVLDDVGERGDREVGHAQRVQRHAAARQVQRLVADALGHLRRIRRRRAHDLQRVRLGNGLAQRGAGGAGERHDASAKESRAQASGLCGDGRGERDGGLGREGSGLVAEG